MYGNPPSNAEVRVGGRGVECWEKNHVLQWYTNADAYGSPLLNWLKYTDVETSNRQCSGSCCHQLP